jgi:hypothetical protein
MVGQRELRCGAVADLAEKAAGQDVVKLAVR